MSIAYAVIRTTVDLALLALAGVLLFILTTGGGQFLLCGVPISITSVGNPLSFLLVLGFLRWWLARNQPFLGIEKLRLDALDERALSLCRRSKVRLETLSDLEAVRLVTILAALSLLVRLGNAYWHYGFFAGDDVEIHEMTLGFLFREDWPVWQLRNAFYPMVFIFPVQFVSYQLGVSDISNLVLAGRAVVAAVSSGTVVLLFVVARRMFGVPVATLAGLLLAGSALSVTMGSTELPRPVAAFFLVLAFCLHARGTHRGNVGAGVTLGLAASLRFSEGVFLVPCVACMLVTRRWLDAALVTVAFLSSWLAILGAADLLYWGSPLVSLTHIVDFTLVKGLSARGYQSIHFYLSHLTEWTNVFTAGLALLAFRFKALAPALWGWLPVFLLSLLPHKEPRYLVPVLPFIALAGGAALWEVLHRCTLAGTARRSLALALVTGAVAAAIFELSGFRFPRSERSVDLAISLREEWGRDGVAVEQLWRLGGRLYLPRVKVVDLPPEGLGESLSQVVAGEAVGWILLLKGSAHPEQLRLLRDAGYDEVLLSQGTYLVFRRGT